jgi:hypothetical protein
MLKYIMRIESSTKLIQVRLYDEHADNYCLSFFIFKDGERGIISGLNGDDFYKNIVTVFKHLRDDYGINIIHGSVTKTHARLIRMFSPGFTVTYEPTQCEGRAMVWITASLL